MRGGEQGHMMGVLARCSGGREGGRDIREAGGASNASQEGRNCSRISTSTSAEAQEVRTH
jgi:hypothetical protein